MMSQSIEGPPPEGEARPRRRNFWRSRTAAVAFWTVAAAMGYLIVYPILVGVALNYGWFDRAPTGIQTVVSASIKPGFWLYENSSIYQWMIHRGLEWFDML